MSFPQKLKALREANHMTQAELGKCINVARATIAGYERRDRQPSHEKLLALADTFNVTIDYLLDADEDSSETEITLQQTHEPDENAMLLYQKLSPRSREDAYKYLQLLELRDKYSDS